MTDLSVPRAERRGVCFSEAIIDWRKEIEGVVAERTGLSLDRIIEKWMENKIPVIADADSIMLHSVKPHIFIDGVMAKSNLGTTLQNAPLVIALGPGFEVGKDCHFAVETNPASPSLGRVLLKGRTEENTREPTPVMGLTKERLLKAPATGRLVTFRNIGDTVKKEEIVGQVDSAPITAPIPGCVWGLMRQGIRVERGQKIGDINPRGNRRNCFEITAEARAIADGVLKGIRSFSRI